MPTEDFPPGTVDGLRLTATTVGGVIVKVADGVELPTLHVIVTTFWVATGDVVALNTTLTFPAAT